MALTAEQRKQLLGRGGLARVARKARRTAGHVTEVNSRLRPDEKVRTMIAQEIVKKNPHITFDEVWPKSA
jgi:hypothetical protein